MPKNDKPKSIMDILSNGTHDLPIDQTMEHVYKFHGKTIKNQMDAIRQSSIDMRHKGMTQGGSHMKIASIPEDVYDMLIQKYGRERLQEPQFWVWFLEKHPHFKYFPSTRMGTKKD